MTATHHPRIRVTNHGPKNWRHEVLDDADRGDLASDLAAAVRSYRR